MTGLLSRRDVFSGAVAVAALAPHKLLRRGGGLVRFAFDPGLPSSAALAAQAAAAGALPCAMHFDLAIGMSCVAEHFGAGAAAVVGYTTPAARFVIQHIAQRQGHRFAVMPGGLWHCGANAAHVIAALQHVNVA